MDVRLSTLTQAELEDAMAHLAASARFLRATGDYWPAAKCRALAAECGQHLLRREADHRQHIDRQLSLAPPGAYDVS